MKDIGPGTVLGGRYALHRRLSAGRDIERWSAHDATLERAVALTIVGSGHANRAGVLDAARRAAGVEDSRLVRILDVGTQSDNSFIVEEAMSGSQSLAAILVQGPLPAEEARRVAGETAKGLEAAGRRGLHHLKLTPQSVMITPDGAVRVSGVAIAAATEARDDQEPDAATASRRDALCLVGIVYAALTGRWPLDDNSSGLEHAPTSIDGPVAPSEIAAGLPRDLDALCRMTLNESAGPLTPADFANQIAPWPRDQVRRAGVDPTVLLQQPSAANAGEDGAATARVDITQGADLAPSVDVPDNVEATGGGPVMADASARTVAMSHHDMGTRDAADPSSGPAHAVEPPKPAAEPLEPAEETAPAPEPVSLTAPLSLELEDVEPPLPLLPASTAQPPSRGQSKFVVLIVATFVLFALFVGYQGLIGLGSITDRLHPTPTHTATERSPSASAPVPAAGPAGPIAILSATGFDPQGDRTESNDAAPRVYDGNPATVWSTELYNTAQFGNLKKGVGVLLDLGQPTSVHQVTIDLGAGPVDVTAYAATGPSLQGATVIGTASGASGRVQLKAGSAMPEAQYVIVWFTSLAPVGGQFGASVAEIALS